MQALSLMMHDPVCGGLAVGAPGSAHHHQPIARDEERQLDDEPEPGAGTLGGYALSLGVAAVVGALVPVAGELIAIPAGVLAVVLGLLGLRRYETGRARQVGPAAAGALLGALGLFAVVVVMMASR